MIITNQFDAKSEHVISQLDDKIYTLNFMGF